MSENPFVFQTQKKVWVLQKDEDGTVMIEGVFDDLNEAKLHLVNTYPNLSAWDEAVKDVWVADTGKHSCMIERIPYWRKDNGTNTD